jgi:hypothetical protein
MELTLNSDERELLMEVLEAHHHELLREISRAKHHEFKSALKNKERLLETVINKVKVAQPGELTVCSA